MTTKKTLLITFVIALFGLVFAFTLFGYKNIEPEPPFYGGESSPRRQKSTIILPVDIDVGFLEDKVNDVFPSGVLTSGSRRASNTKSYSYSLSRNPGSEIKVAATRGGLRFDVPLHISANGSYQACVGYWHKGKCRTTPFTKGITQTEHGSITKDIVAVVNVSLTPTPDYRLQTNTDVTPVIQGKIHLKMDLIGDLIRISVDVTDKIRAALSGKKDHINRKINGLLQEQLRKIKYKKDIQKAWNKLADPIKSGDVWIKAKPDKVVFQNIQPVDGGKLRVAIGFTGGIEVSLTKPARTELGPIPKLTTLEPDHVGGFNLSIPLTSSFADLTKKTNEEVANMLLNNEDGYFFKVKKVRLSGIILEDQEKLLLKVYFDAGKNTKLLAKGHIYLIGEPYYRPNSRTVGIRDFSISSQTNNLILDKGLPWLLEFQYKEITSLLSYDVGREIDKVTGQVNEKLKKGIPVDKDVTLTGSIDVINFGGFYINEKKLELYVNGRGKAKLVVQEGAKNNN